MSSGEYVATRPEKQLEPPHTLLELEHWLSSRALKLAIGMQGGFYYVRLSSRLRGFSLETSGRALETAVHRAVAAYERREP